MSSASESSSRCKCLSEYPSLQALLPNGYEQRVCSYTSIGDGFHATIRLKATSKDGALKWLSDFESKSFTTFRVRRTFPGSGRKNVFKVDLRCQHNNTKKSQRRSSKNTGCPATATIIVKRTMISNNRLSRSLDNPHLSEGFPTTVHMRYEHNHPINSADAMKHRDVSEQTVAKLDELSDSGHSPSSAHEVIPCDSQEGYAANYVHASGDRAICPDLQFCYSASQEMDDADKHDVRLETRLEVSDSALRYSVSTDSDIKQDEIYSTLATDCEVSTGIPTHCMDDNNILPALKHERPEDMQADPDYNQQGDCIHDHVVTCLPSVTREEPRQELNEQKYDVPFHSTDQGKRLACDVCEPIQVKQEATEDPDGYDRHNGSTRHWIVCPGGVLKEVNAEHTSDVSEILSVEGCNENVGREPITHTCTHSCKGVKPFTCDTSGKSFTHTRRRHAGVKSFTCDTCGESFANSRQLNVHKRTHTAFTPFTCDTCGQSFANLAHLSYHKRTHAGVKPFTCDTCGKSFANSGTLTIHKRIHMVDNGFTCDTCGKPFACSGHLKSHKRTHTDTKPSTCDICGKSFAHSGYLKMHKRKHTVLKPFTCDPCGISFAQAGQLKCHQKAHTGVRPFTCDTCGKSYIGSGHLERHVMTHTGMKYFTCDTCGKSYTVSRHLKWHQMTHRSVLPFTRDTCVKHVTCDTVVKPVACDTGVNL